MDGFHDQLIRMADEAGRASSIQEAVTDARMVLGVRASATYTEDLANVFREIAERVRNLRDQDVTDFLNRLNDAVMAGEPVTLWGVDYVKAPPRTVDDVMAEVFGAILQHDSDKIDSLVHEAYEIGKREAAI